MDNQQRRDIEAARSRSSVDTRALRDILWLDGRRDALDKVVEVMRSDPVFDKDARRHLSRAQLLERGYAIQLRLIELKRSLNWGQEELDLAMSLVDDHIPFGLHYNAFIPVLKSQGSDAQIAEWLPRSEALEVIGCYAQTELGHGSNVQALETTATYAGDHFILHSPAFTSAKWWIGGLGTVANHAVVQAQLLLGGKNYGPHLFIVQLRDAQHRTLPGVHIGDIGPKHYGGFNMNDNGFARFDRVRVPADRMLSRYASIRDGGAYVPAKHAKIGYGSMVALRAGMPTTQGLELAKCATIAVRYTTVRRQFQDIPQTTDKLEDGATTSASTSSSGSAKEGAKLESAVIGYSGVKERLYPILARSYVYVLTGHAVMSLYREMLDKLVRPPHDASLLAEVHLLTSGLKACLSWRVADGMEESRKALGGHGFSIYSGIGERFAREVPGQTYEGDNYVLTQQTARGLLKNLQAVMAARGDAGKAMRCFRPLVAELRPDAPPLDGDDDSTAALVRLLARRTTTLLVELATRARSAAWHTLNMLCVRLTKAFCEWYTASTFFERADAHPSLGALLRVYVLSCVTESLGDFAEHDLLDGAACKRLRYELWPAALAALDADVVALTDAFGFSDFELNSCLGRRDGDAYAALWRQVNERNPVNIDQPGWRPASVEAQGASGTIRGWEQFIQPLKEAAAAKI